MKVDIDAPGPSTSGQTSSRSLRPTRKRLGRPILKSTQSSPFDWKRACKEMLEALWNSRDSEPFRYSINNKKYLFILANFF